MYAIMVPLSIIEKGCFIHINDDYFVESGHKNNGLFVVNFFFQGINHPCADTCVR